VAWVGGNRLACRFPTVSRLRSFSFAERCCFAANHGDGNATSWLTAGYDERRCSAAGGSSPGIRTRLDFLAGRIGQEKAKDFLLKWWVRFASRGSRPKSGHTTALRDGREPRARDRLDRVVPTALSWAREPSSLRQPFGGANRSGAAPRDKLLVSQNERRRCAEPGVALATRK
jgi:hypothetical protein